MNVKTSLDTYWVNGYEAFNNPIKLGFLGAAQDYVPPPSCVNVETPSGAG